MLFRSKTIWRKWTCAFAFITCFIIIYVQHIYDMFQELSFYYIEYWSPIIFICLFLIVWLILSQRIFFRDGWKVLIWIGCWLTLTLSFPLYISFSYSRKFDRLAVHHLLGVCSCRNHIMDNNEMCED